MSECQTYLRSWLGIALGLTLSVALTNLLVDPYGFYGLVNIEGFNSIKPHAESHSAMVRPYLIDRVRPRSILLGDSRVEVGFDPETEVWPDDARPVLNLGVPGTGSGVHLRMVQNAARHGHLKYVLVGLHFNDFLVAGNSRGKTDQEPANGERGPPVERDVTPNVNYWRPRLADIGSTLLSFDALSHSVLTIAEQRKPYPAHLTALGFNPNRNFTWEVKTSGQYYLFQAWLLGHYASYAAAPKYIFNAGSKTSDNFEDLRAIMGVCRAHGVKLYLIIYPYHAQMLELTRAAGLWELFEDWKRELTRIVDDEARRHPGTSTARLWDFSGYTVLTTETVPPRDDRKTMMRWYWEAGHFTKEFGDLILDRILNVTREGRDAADDVGVQLTPDNVENHLARIRTQQVAYEHAHRGDVAEIEEQLARYVRQRAANR